MEGDVTALVSAEELMKRYRPDAVALGPVSFEVTRPSIVGLVGPNGAGKTTLIRILTTQLMPTSGGASVFGLDVVRDAPVLRERIALLPQEVSFEFYMMNPEDYIKTYLRIRGLGRHEAKVVADETIARFALGDIKRRPMQDLSGGQVRKALLAMVLASPNAEVFFLDEPTTGLDPVARRQVWDVLNSVVNAGKTIFLTSHHMDEVSSMADEIMLLKAGRILARGSPTSVIEAVAKEYPGKLVLRGEAPRWLGEVGRVYKSGNHTVVYSTDMEKIAGRLAAENVPFEAGRLDLEDAFILLESR